MRSESLILAFDTSAAHCAAALLFGETLLSEHHETMERGQAERLLPMLEAMLRSNGYDWSDLDALAVGTGPGNFTGIRIAVATARGLALGLGIPAVGVSIFEARAEGLPRPVCIVEPARRGEVYLQFFSPEPSPPQIIASDTFHAPPEYAIAGSAVDLLADKGLQNLGVRYNTAEAIARVARRRLGETPSRPVPLYLRPADAAPPSEPPPVLLP